MQMKILLAATLLAGAAAASPACGAQPEPGCTAPDAAACARGERVRTWRQVASEDDRRRIRQWRSAFVEARGEARGSGHGDEVDREGPLLDPDSALPGAALPQGEFRCRTIKLGSQSESGPDYVAYPWFRCRVEPGADGSLHFTKLDGSQRPIGRLYAEHDRRQIFLGAMQLGDETRALRYGRDRLRNLAGIVERIGERRWRILFPYPHFESKLDVIELTYAP
jgi:hypothetical protein